MKTNIKIINVFGTPTIAKWIGYFTYFPYGTSNAKTGQMYAYYDEYNSRKYVAEKEGKYDPYFSNGYLCSLYGNTSYKGGKKRRKLARQCRMEILLYGNDFPYLTSTNIYCSKKPYWKL